MAVRALHLCSGYGGFELALRPFGVSTVAHVERDAHAAAVVVARMADEALDQAPVWDDLSTFDGRPWRGRVDLVTAGFPCQPFSSAGQRGGVDDDRWLWPDIERIVAEVGPRFVVVENVPELVRHGLPEVLCGLARLGFDAEWGLFAASDVGAPHRRQRLWLLAYADRGGLQELGQLAGSLGAWMAGDVDGSGRADVGDASGARRRQDAGRSPGDEGTHGRGTHRTDLVERAGEDVADAACIRQREQDREACAIARHHARLDARWRGFPPRPDDTDGWAAWIAGGGPEPQVRRSPDGATGRMVRPVGLADRLHLLGNGLVPQCATEAIRQLAERALT